jgi:hypothetical protein
MQNDVEEYLGTCTDLIQGDSLACAQFKFAMEKGVERTGGIYYRKYVKILLLARRDDIDIMGRRYEHLKTPFNRQS